MDLKLEGLKLDGLNKQLSNMQNNLQKYCRIKSPTMEEKKFPDSRKISSNAKIEKTICEEEDKIVTVGLCAMNKKTLSRPMKEILKRLQCYDLLKFQIFPDEVTLNEPIENWPIVDCLISFYSKGFPLNKAIAYAKLRKPLVLNDLDMQWKLQDRREVYRILEEAGCEMVRYAVFNRGEQNQPESGKEIFESDDMIIVNGKVFRKPFVEKPVDAEDHNIYIYYPSSAGGGCQILFRKIGSRSSVYSQESRIRRQGSYIYEDFMPTDGTDVKVYTVGENYAHAEARKSPVLDGKVDRDCLGKEIRYPVILTAHEKLIAKKVCSAFKQTVCGFDLLRANGKSLVCDVNGFSFVKTSQKYYDDCSQLLADIILKRLAPQLWIPPQQSTKMSSVHRHSRSHNKMELRSVVAIIRHGDRTPKQKMKMVVTHQLFADLWSKYSGHKEGRLKLKKPSQLQEILDITIALLEGNDDNVGTVYENKNKLHQMKSVLQMYDHFSGINRKVQIKAMNDKRNYDMITKFKGRNKKCTDTPTKGTQQQLLLILKWGGELTPMGQKQAEELGKAFRCLYPGGQGEYGRMPGLGYLRLHSTYQHDLKIYASDEGRVQVTAAAFAKGLLALEGELPPVLVSLVKSDKNVTGMLDTPGDVSGVMQRVKSRLHEQLHSDEDFTGEDEKKLAPESSTSITQAMEKVGNPRKMCVKILSLVHSLTDQIKKLCNDPCTDQNSQVLYNDESLNLMRHRWEKLEKDFFSGGEFDISLIPDIYDGVKYDFVHNKTLGLNNLSELYTCSKALADIVIPLEYGITADEKKTISSQICTSFFKKLKADLNYNVKEQRMDPGLWRDYGMRHGESCSRVRTRLYMTSESHVHSIVSAIRYNNMFKSMTDEQWERSMAYMNEVSELNYLTQIVFMQYEDPTQDPTSPKRFHVELFFSPGVRCPNVEKETKTKVTSEPIPFAKKQGQSLDDVKLRRFSTTSCPYRAGYSPVQTSHLAKDDLTLISNVKDTTSVQGADVIETLPSLHPLVCLHGDVGQFEIENMLDEFIGEELKSPVVKDFRTSLCKLDSIPIHKQAV